MKRLMFNKPDTTVTAGLYLGIFLGLAACLGQGQLALESSTAAYVSSADDLIGGPAASAGEGDVVLRNHLVRAIIQHPLRDSSIVSNAGPIPFGGGLVDLDIQRGKSADGYDRFGRQGLMYNWGRTARWNDLQIVDDGTISGNAIVELRGTDSLNPAVNFSAGLNKEDASAGGVTAAMIAVADPERAVPVQIRQRYTLVPGSALIEIQTWFYNEGVSDVVLVVGDWIDTGATGNVFVPGTGLVQGTVHGFGLPGTEDVGVQGAGGLGGLDNGYAWQYFAGLLAPTERDRQPASQMCLTWERANLCATGLAYDHASAAIDGPGLLQIAPGEEGTFIRHIGVHGIDLASLAGEHAIRSGQQHNVIRGQMSVDAAYPATAATVALLQKSGSDLIPYTVALADAEGAFQAEVLAGEYVAVPYMVGMSVPTPAFFGTTADPIVVSASDAAELDAVSFPAGGTLKVFVQNERRREAAARILIAGEGGTPSVVALDANGLQRIPAAQAGSATTALWHETGSDTLAAPRVITDYEGDTATVSTIRAVHTTSLNGRLSVPLPPGEWTVIATHGNESGFDLQKVTISAGEESVASLLVPRVVSSYRMVSMHLGAQSVAGTRSRLLVDQRVETALADSIDVLVAAEDGGRRDPQNAIDAIALDIDSNGVVDVEGGAHLLGLSGGSIAPWGMGPVMGAILAAQPEAARDIAAIGVDDTQVLNPDYNQGGALPAWSDAGNGTYTVPGLGGGLALLNQAARYTGQNLNTVSAQLLRDYRFYYDFDDGVYDPEQGHLQTAVQPGLSVGMADRLRLSGGAQYHDGFTWITVDPGVRDELHYGLSHLFGLLNLGKDVRLLFAGDSVRIDDASLANSVNYVSMGIPADDASGIDQEDSVLSALKGGAGLASSGFYVEVTGVLRVYDGAATQQSAQEISPSATPWIARRTANTGSAGLSLNDIAAGYAVTVHVMVEVQSPHWAKPASIRVYRNTPVYAQPATLSAADLSNWVRTVPAASYDVNPAGDPALASVEGSYKYAEDVTVPGEANRWELTQTFSFDLTTASELVDQWFVVTVEGQQDAFPVLFDGASGLVPKAVSWPIKIDIDGLGWQSSCDTNSCVYE